MLQIKKLFFGTLLNLVLAVGLFSVAAFLIQKLGALPEGGMAGTIVMIIGIVAVFFSALLTAHWVGEKGLIHGTVIALIVIALYCIGAMVICGSDDLVSLAVRAISFLLSGMIGGVVGVGQKSGRVRF